MDVRRAFRRLWPKPPRDRIEPYVTRGPVALEITDEATIVADDATHAMRKSDFPLWAELRARLEAEGIDARASAIADSYHVAPLGVEVGIVVSREGRVMRFRYEDGFSEWTEITDTWRSSGVREAQYIEDALRGFGDERSPST